MYFHILRKYLVNLIKTPSKEDGPKFTFNQDIFGKTNLYVIETVLDCKSTIVPVLVDIIIQTPGKKDDESGTANTSIQVIDVEKIYREHVKSLFDAAKKKIKMKPSNGITFKEVSDDGTNI